MNKEELAYYQLTERFEELNSSEPWGSMLCPPWLDYEANKSDTYENLDAVYYE